MNVLGIIPARGGSKGVPRKNVRLMCGKPLLAYTAEAALRAKNLTRVILSTEDLEVSEIGKRHGLDVPFLRPSELAEDNTPTLPVIQHAVRYLAALGEKYDAICLLQPTNPLRRPEDIDNCIDLLESTKADSVISVLSVPTEYNPSWVYWKDNGGGLVLSTGDMEPTSRRQDLREAFHRDGSVYATRMHILLEQDSLYGTNIQAYEMNKMYSANIDTLKDWEKVEAILSSRGNSNCQ